MTIKFLNLSITGVMLRFYLMMATVIVAGFTGAWALALLALPIFVSIMLGISFEKENKALKASVIKMNPRNKEANSEEIKIA